MTSDDCVDDSQVKWQGCMLGWCGGWADRWLQWCRLWLCASSGCSRPNTEIIGPTINHPHIALLLASAATSLPQFWHWYSQYSEKGNYLYIHHTYSHFDGILKLQYQHVELNYILNIDVRISISILENSTELHSFWPRVPMLTRTGRWYRHHPQHSAWETWSIMVKRSICAGWGQTQDTIVLTVCHISTSTILQSTIYMPRHLQPQLSILSASCPRRHDENFRR